MIKILWFAVVMTAHGPVTLQVEERETFADNDKCLSFAARMAPRLADYVRGAAGLDWPDRVHISFKCEPNGQPI